MKNIMKYSIAIGMIMLTLSGCDKFLDEKPQSRLVVASNLKDLQGLMDNYLQANNNDVASGEIAADDYYITDAEWAAQPEYDRRLHTWEKENVMPASGNDYYYSYQQLYRANTVLATIDQVNKDNLIEWNNVKGQAHFMRARLFLQLVLLFGKAYDPNTAKTDLGIPLRLGTDFNEKSVRATLEETYQQIIKDLEEACKLLPNKPVHVMRSSKPAAYALLARTYLAMGNFEKAGLYADLSLQLKSDLLDYNTLNAAAAFPFAQFNTEVEFSAVMATPAIIANATAKIPLVLYNQYQANDLRKTLYFRKNTDGSYGYKGSYDGGTPKFTGISVNEVYLMRAESFARQGKLTEAMKDLNTLMRKRHNNTYVDKTAADKQQAIDIILTERRKELLIRGLRWMDLKRLNKLGANITLSRTINSKTYTLEPNSPKYAIEIPPTVIALTGMPQNP
ncbi:MAG: RagB/SusD family nutrient uptake outer membrane protein [Pedobacter sp.]|nr:RagB/SusD family nutrient uptake outer membrane protein [Pedobacter sp.]MDQ8052394.1 RagB/SusD family nutrient uptake outer membrane protein [Pedobacter sp.]